MAAALPGIDLIGAELVRLPRMQPGTLFGSGKVAELKTQFQAQEIDLVLVDGPVTPGQQRNLEKEWGVKLLDRTGLILEIFADRARTREGGAGGCGSPESDARACGHDGACACACACGRDRARTRTRVCTRTDSRCSHGRGE